MEFTKEKVIESFNYYNSFADEMLKILKSADREISVFQYDVVYGFMFVLESGGNDLSDQVMITLTETEVFNIFDLKNDKQKLKDTLTIIIDNQMEMKEVSE